MSLGFLSLSLSLNQTETMVFLQVIFLYNFLVVSTEYENITMYVMLFIKQIPIDSVCMYSDNAQSSSNHTKNKEVCHELKVRSMTAVQCTPTNKWNLFIHCFVFFTFYYSCAFLHSYGKLVQTNHTIHCIKTNSLLLILISNVQTVQHHKRVDIQLFQNYLVEFLMAYKQYIHGN